MSTPWRLITGVAEDAQRSTSELIAEHALLRQQLKGAAVLEATDREF